ncbi:hypothetical protein [Bacillus xiapuensis]|uniref:Uncharacterized protein n=1 Tax=Bacillus xiapuensis TaxID=2014075 RepID=A0ABU6NFZ4_9BACI|nr:hypothetical protein [Bacillus xiapuensis]
MKPGSTEVIWGLRTDSPFYFSSKFNIENKTITIRGSQTTHDHLSPIKYSIVKLSKFGLSIEYFDSVIFYGNHSEKELAYTFTVPNGTGYQLEIFNYCSFHSTGKIWIGKNEDLSKKIS